MLTLELRLYPDARFRFHDPTEGRDLLSLDEATQAREEVEARLGQTEGRRRTEDRLQESEAARQALEAELRTLRRRLHGRGQEPDDLGPGR